MSNHRTPVKCSHDIMQIALFKNKMRRWQVITLQGPGVTFGLSSNWSNRYMDMKGTRRTVADPGLGAVHPACPPPLDPPMKKIADGTRDTALTSESSYVGKVTLRASPLPLNFAGNKEEN